VKPEGEQRGSCSICGGGPRRTPQHCHACCKRRRRIQDTIRDTPHAVWRPARVEQVMKAQPPDFWESSTWRGCGAAQYANRLLALKSLLGDQCFDVGGIAGPVPNDDGGMGHESSAQRPVGQQHEQCQGSQSAGMHVVAQPAVPGPCEDGGRAGPMEPDAPTLVADHKEYTAGQLGLRTAQRGWLLRLAAL
jgi:hypothetical protein